MTHPNGEGGDYSHLSPEPSSWYSYTISISDSKFEDLSGNRENGMHQLGQAILNETIDSIPFLGSIFNS